MASAMPAQLPRLTSLRWFAALAVFAAHSTLIPRALQPAVLGPPGQTGVAFFFALSGLVLAWSAPPSQTARELYRHRFARIYPSTMVAMLLAAVLIASGIPVGRRGVLGAVTNALFVQAWFPGRYPVFAYNGVAWSLSCEAFFYLCLPLILRLFARWTDRRITQVAGGLLALDLVFSAAILHGSGGGYFTPLMTINNPLLRLPEFIAGVALGVRLRRGWVPKVHFPAAAACFLVAWIAAGMAQERLPFSVLLVPGTLCVLAAAASADIRRVPGRVLTRRSVVWLGEASFCFYLLHHMVLLVLAQWLSGMPWSLVGLACSIAAAAALHHLVELPAQRLLRAPQRQIGMPQPRQPVSVQYTST